MPILPKRNTLDYNPNSIINASRSIKTISLENMKNPVLDPDMKTLSVMDAERDLDSNLEQLKEMYEDLSLTGSKLQSLAGFKIKIPKGLEGAGKKKGGVKKKDKPNIELIVDEEEEKTIGTEETKRRGRPIGSKNKPRGQVTSVASSSLIPTISPRFQDTLVSSTGNSVATPMNDPNDDEPDDDASSLPSSLSSNSRTYRRNRSGRSIPSEPSEPSYNEGEGEYEGEYSSITLIGLLYSLISKINKITFFINSRIKPVLRKLKASHQGFLKSLQQSLYNYYDTVFLTPQTSGVVFYGNLENYIISEVSNGDDILQQIKEALKSCLLSLTVTLNASLQSSDVEIEYSPADTYALRIAGFEGDPSGRMSIGETRTRQYDRQGKIILGSGRKPRMLGCGRNFYGETINNTRDIPTIWRSVQHIPTKYLL